MVEIVCSTLTLLPHGICDVMYQASKLKNVKMNVVVKKSAVTRRIKVSPFTILPKLKC